MTTNEKGAHHTPPVQPMRPIANGHNSDFNAPTYALPNVLLVSGLGQYHSNEANAKVKRSYMPVMMSIIETMLENPPSSDKTKAQWAIFSTLESRTFAEQLEKGEFWALWADFDEQPKPLDEIEAIWREIAPNTVAWFYTSRSATAENPKSRMIVPLARPLDGATFTMAQACLNDAFESRGFIADRAAERPAQLCYLPNRGEFYDWRKTDGHVFDLEADGSALHPFYEQRHAVEQKRMQRALERKKLRRARQRDDGNVTPIDWFNTAHSVDDILLAAGYEPDPHHPDKYRHPYSESGSFSACIWREGLERVSTLSTSDALYVETGEAHDAFSAWCILEHGGDEQAALQAAKQMQTEADFTDLTTDSHANVDATETANTTTEVMVPSLEPDLPDDAPPPEIEPFRGVMTDLVNAITNSAHRQQPMLSVAAALAGMAAGVNGIFHLPDGGRMNLYIIGLSASGTGKDHPRRCAEAIAECAAAYIVGQLVSSAGLEDSMPTGSPAAPMLLALDEVGDFIGAVNNTNAPIYMKQLHGMLLKLFSASATAYYGRPLAGKKGKLYPNPMVSLFGLTTEEGLGDELPLAAIEKGLLGRVLMVRGRDDAPMRIPPESFEVPESAEEAAHRIRSEAYTMMKDDYSVALSDDAAPYYQHLMNSFETPNAEPLMATLQRRSFEKVGRIAGTLAVWDNAATPVIEREHLDWARRFVELSNSTVVQFASDKLHTDRVQADAAKVKKIIAGISKGKYSPDRGNELAAVQQRLAPKSLTLRRSKLNTDDFDRAMRHLLESNDVVVEPFKTPEMPKPMATYRLMRAGK